MPPSSGGLLSVSHSDRQTVAHAQPYRYTQAHTVCTPYTLYAQGQRYVCKQKYAKMHNTYLWICKHFMLKKQQGCQPARQHIVTFWWHIMCCTNGMHHIPLNFRLLQWYNDILSNMLRFYCMVDQPKLIWNWMTITCWRTFLLHRNGWVTICAEQSKEKKEKRVRMNSAPLSAGKKWNQDKKRRKWDISLNTLELDTRSSTAQRQPHPHTSTHNRPTHIHTPQPLEIHRTSWAHSFRLHTP